jgi:hypothetical protein
MIDRDGHWATVVVISNKELNFISSRDLDNFSTEEYVTSSVLGQGVFDSPSLTLVIGANIF